ncbi:non-ribosomal peptide synthetase [Bacillus cereus]|uniref:non-ribosomal peptide synthetase n=1 Tax=Bacillus cereus TaxID=1396 RepID=UPI001879FD23|nr:non-ribosomal peptide synthetase [Bacillus cereus]MBE7122189.1 amino acid adenylation domain-containing protein [Bacillus cereus]
MMQYLSALSNAFTEQERELLKELNNTRTDYPKDKCIHELFEERVKIAPDAIAIELEGSQITYRELNNRANQLGRFLKKCGIRSGTIIGVYMNRSIDLFISWLGVIKAGGAYLPIDPEYPEDRIQYMISDSGAKILLTQKDWKHSLTKYHPSVIDLDDRLIDEESTENISNTETSDSLAYIIYTSGSTGKPKGVAVSQKAIVRIVCQTNYINITPSDIIAQISNASFDAITFEVWGALLNGAKLVIANQNIIFSPQDFADWLIKSRSTTMFITTALFNRMVQERPDIFNSLQNLLFGGEAVDPKWVRESLKHGAPKRLLHVYGPTENTTFTTWYLIQQVAEEATTIPIGSPISNTQIYVLDNCMQPVPIGVSGELYIGGDGLARGYWNRPELTKEKFVPNPFSEDPNSRLYKTGDLVRYLPDGNIEFLGRIDHQVKIRGFRIELGEIEEVLKQHEAIKEAVVIVREDIPGDKRLVGYVTSKDETISVSAIQEFLKEKMPKYMVPSAIVCMDILPLTPNGKIDKSVLPKPNQREVLSEYVPPRNEIEELLVNVWKEVLNIDQVGVYDNFFELGGHSLLAIQVISRLFKELQLNLSIDVMFKCTTVNDLAKELERKMKVEQMEPILKIEKVFLNEADLLPSFSQQGLWFIDQFDPGSSAYNIPFSFRFTGSLDLEVLKQSLSTIVKRHEVLRSVFTKSDGQPKLTIVPFNEVDFCIIDLKEVSKEKKETQAMKLIQQEASKPFDLVKGPLFRFGVICLTDQEHLVYINIHHIVFDGWSLSVFMNELEVLYKAYLDSEPSILPELSIQYIDYAYWQRRWSEGKEFNKQLSYWKKQLSGELPNLQLPTNRLCSKRQTASGANYKFKLSSTLSDQLKLWSRQEGITLNMTLLAAFKVLLFKYTGQKDLLVGTPIAGRNREEIEKLIGFFVNTLLIRTNLNGNPTFKEFLNQVRDVCLEAYSNQDVPFEKVVEELNPERHVRQSTFFEVMFIHQNMPVKYIDLPKLKVESIDIGKEVTKFDLTMITQEEEGFIVGEIVYDCELFDTYMIKRMAGHYQQLLELILENPFNKVDTLSMVTEAEREQLVVEWNKTETEYPNDKCIHELFEEQVEKSPNSIAVEFESQTFTYQELNNCANQLAHFLREHGVKAETLVGICMEKSIDMVIGILGILKAGGYYLPLDPSHPKDRLKHMVEEADPKLIISQQSLSEKCRHFYVGKVLCVNEKSIQLKKKSNLIKVTTPESLAYVYYTSGSTGKPKGIVNIHKGVVNYLSFLSNAYHISDSDIVLQLASFSWDAAIRDTLKPLTVGAKLVLISENDSKDPNIILSKIEDCKITCILSIIPARLKTLTSTYKNSNCNSVRLILVSGEMLTKQVVEHTYRAFKNALISNQYGPTECTLTTSFFPIDPQKDFRKENISVGRPIDNMQIYLLDEYLQPVPVGVIGGIYIGGVGVTKGYLNQPELTASRFIQNPFDKKSDSYIYKTGDLACYLPDGNIELLGRSDRQVKIRGFRVELDELEGLLEKNPKIVTAIVVVKQDKNRDNLLICYIHSHDCTDITVSELHQYLSDFVPNYMIPSHFILIDSIPLTTNGKIDRRALPDVDPNKLKLKMNYVEPRGYTEQTLVKIWSQVLDIDLIGIYDNFFELGGHSLIATRVLSRICSTFNIELPLSILFEAPIIAELADRINLEIKIKKSSGMKGRKMTKVARSKIRLNEFN